MGRYKLSETSYFFSILLEFPEVFEDSRGFDAIIGNPPFIGGQKITGLVGRPYREYLVKRVAHGKRGSADYAAYFFLRSRKLLREGGCFGLLATNTIAQGDTREVGLDQLTPECSIMRAISSQPWPGEANLEVAHVWARLGKWSGAYFLDREETSGISSLLTPPGRAVGNPYRLRANEGKSFQGSNVLGLGFTLSPETARDLLASNCRNADVLFPYLNGEDLNSHPAQSARRWIINFSDWPLERAEEYPRCLNIVREKVKPERDLNRYSTRAREYWWQFERVRAELYGAIANLGRVLVRTQTSRTQASVFVHNGSVYDQKLIVFATSAYSDFALLDSSFHYFWVLQRGSSMRTDPVYTPSDCFLTFPFPNETHALESVGEMYHSARSQVMLARQIGLTNLSHLLHDSTCQSPDIEDLRTLQSEMDRSVASTYGWSFDLDYGFHETKQGRRFTISSKARMEALDLLLALNHKRYQIEKLQPRTKRARAARGRRESVPPSLFE